jgi:hypothetical protein
MNKKRSLNKISLTPSTHNLKTHKLRFNTKSQKAQEPQGIEATCQSCQALQTA